MMKKQYTYAYDPELDLWAIIDPEGYTFDWEVFKRTVVIHVKKLNKESSKESSQ